MKKIIGFFIAMAFIASTAIGQVVVIPTEQVPANVRTTFNTMFPYVSNGAWELHNGNEFAVRFSTNNEDVTAHFDEEGRWTYSRTRIPTSAIPAPVQTSLSKQFPEFAVTDAVRHESAAQVTCYEARLVRETDNREREIYDICIGVDGDLKTKVSVDPMQVTKKMEN